MDGYSRLCFRAIPMRKGRAIGLLYHGKIGKAQHPVLPTFPALPSACFPLQICTTERAAPIELPGRETNRKEDFLLAVGVYFWRVVQTEMAELGKVRGTDMETPGCV